MATTPRKVTYPESDGKPLAETGIHAEVMLDLYYRLKQHFAADPMVYVAVNLFVYYVEGDPRKNVAPDVWMARGVPAGLRRVFLVWEEPRGPEMIVEATSRKTRRQDLKEKLALYRDVLHVREYFLFDPEAEYLEPPLQGFRLIEGEYVPIEAVQGRLPSEVAGIHLEREGQDLRLYNPATGGYLTPIMKLEEEEQRARREADVAHEELERARREADAAHEELDRVRREADAAQDEAARLRKELDDLRRRLTDQSA